MLIVEELGEWAETVAKDRSKEEQQQEWADLLYVVLGTADVAGYNVSAAMEYVMQKNQKKIDNVGQLQFSSHGKILKPEDLALKENQNG